MPKRTLEYGQTPWDKLTREELLREVWRMYDALSASRSCLSILRSQNPNSLFWTQGSGGQALASGDAIIEGVEAEYDSENIYRAFFRYAADLLHPHDTFGWTACDGCNSFIGVGPEQSPVVGQPCRECETAGKHHLRRHLEWKDILGPSHPMLAVLAANASGPEQAGLGSTPES